MVMKNLRPVSTCKMVTWIKPAIGKVKVNTDGSFSSNGAGIGGIIRNEGGTLIMAFTAPLACYTDNFAEAYAAKFRIR